MLTDFDSQAPFDLSIPDQDPAGPPEYLGTSGAIWDIQLPLNLTDIQFRAIELTIQGHRDTQIAHALSINRKTLWRWKNLDDDYRQALTSARIFLHATTADRCQTIAQKATAVLAGFLDDSDDKNRLRAAHVLLSVASRFKPVTPIIHPKASAPREDFPEPVLEEKMG